MLGEGRRASHASPLPDPKEETHQVGRRPRMLSPTASTWEEVLGVTGGEFNQHTGHLTAFVWVCVRAHRRATVFRRIRSPINLPFSSIIVKSFSAGSSDYSMNSNLWSSFQELRWHVSLRKGISLLQLWGVRVKVGGILEEPGALALVLKVTARPLETKSLKLRAIVRGCSRKRDHTLLLPPA